MIFEASLDIAGGGVTARLEPSLNRIEIEKHGTPTPEAIEANIPRLLEHLATRSGLPVRYNGRVFQPLPVTPQDADQWGDN